MAKENQQENLEKRIARLEQKVAALERLLSHNKTAPGRSDNSTPEPGEHAEEPKVHIKEDPASSEKPSRWLPDETTLGKNWLNWLGISLLLLGVAFLFKYSIDQGWLIPPIRSAFGLAIGFGLLGSGFASVKGTTQRQILLGGGIASFYITGFATFQLYSFISPQIVWIFMVGVTLLSLYLASQHNEMILSVLGTAGGLGTPFMLYSGDGSLQMLILYTCLILSGSGALYLLKAWKPLLWTTIIGGWLVLMVGWANNIYNVLEPTLADKWTLQLGALFSAGIFWIIPVVREVLTAKNPSRWSDGPRHKPGTEPKKFVAHVHVQLLSVVIPVLLLFYSYSVWSIGNRVWGVIALISSLILGYSYLPLRKEGLQKLSLVHGFSALIMITISLFLLLEGEVLLISLTLEALCLRIISAKTGDQNIALSSHVLFGFLALWMLDRLMTPSTADLALLNLDALTELFIIGIAGIMVPRYLDSRDRNIIAIYRLAAHIGLLGWFLNELLILQDGQAYVTIAWGIYALLILFLGFYRNSSRIRFLGMLTILLVVGKLFLVDLSQISTLLRILLFIGFGVVFLVVSYLLHQKWGDTD
ncbi:DUF2339 domain-containing protein [Aliifodinibius sp. S!AR15-10]|uniref:DUF2339 domain-containing protein n=1 Tax=Aliifodinibius sp. S!AR15-10 TaxID=2950437 RepID=UPI00285A91E7|nr:DUF2339 domain-containing protein [Aliifodinibius sp. S!AR15-10]MDR8393664.1 DUF2339 domain-containing protein [Aliifodinibius sp. S!AR15-10]